MHLQEEFLYHIWDEGHLAGDLKTESGKTLKIIYPGQYNSNRGPDFVNAVLQIGDETKTGNVEIHLHSYDWTLHNHHEDAHYNQVILHVVLSNNAKNHFTIKENGELAEIIELKHQLSEDIGKLIILHNHNADKSGYCRLMSLLTNDHLESILYEMGRQRFFSKVNRFNTALLLSDYEQIIYEGIMEAMGYDKNKFNFMMIARNLSCSQLRQWFSEGMQLDELISILLFSTGLIEHNDKQLDKESVAYLASVYEAQPYHSQRLKIDWQAFRIRPANHPVFRMLSMAVFLERNLQNGLLKSILSVMESGEIKSIMNGLNKLFPANGLNTTLPIPKLGAGLASNILLNILLPITELYYEKTANETQQQRMFALYREFPGLPVNRIITFMLKHLSKTQARQAVSKATFQQGLIELYYRFCQYHYCNDCINDYQSKHGLSEV